MDKKFAIGEKVLCRKPDEYHVEDMDKYVGQIGVVREYVEEDENYNVVFDDGIDWYFDGSGLELVAKAPAPIAAPAKKEKIVKEKPLFKFNVGDRVKVVAAQVAAPQHGGFARGMQKYEDEGKIFTIEVCVDLDYVYKNIGYRFKEDNGEYIWDERCLKRVRKAPTIVQEPVKPQVGQEAIIDAPIPVVEAPVAPPKVRTEFLVGDRVICVDASNWLVYGKEYVLTAVGEYLYVKGIDKAFYPLRFKHAIVYYEEQKPVVKAPIAPKVIKKKPTLLEVLREKTGNRPGTCSYGVEMADGEFRMHVQDVCHARIPQYRGGEVAKLALDIQGHSFKMKEEEKQESYHKYADYIMNQSPWSPVFHKKGLANALKFGILVDVDKPMYQCQGAAVALREGSEFSAKLPLFEALLDRGYSGNTAYLLSAAVNGTFGGLKFAGLTDGHRVLSGESDAEKMFEFFRNGYAERKDDKPYRTHNKNSEGIYKFISPYTERGVEQINSVLKKGLGVANGAGWDVSYKITDEALFSYADTLETLLNK